MGNVRFLKKSGGGVHNTSQTFEEEEIGEKNKLQKQRHWLFCEIEERAEVHRARVHDRGSFEVQALDERPHEDRHSCCEMAPAFSFFKNDTRSRYRVSFFSRDKVAHDEYV